MKKERKVILLQDVRGDWPIAYHVVAPAGVYTAHVNPHGAVSVEATNGELLGVKHGELQWMDE